MSASDVKCNELQMIDIIEIIKRNTTVFSREQILEWTKGVLSRWTTKRDPGQPLYVNLMDHKIGSVHWLYFEIKDILPPHLVLSRSEFDRIRDRELLNNCEILCVDDFSLSGCFVSAMAEEVLCRSSKNVKYTSLVAVITDKALDEYNNLSTFYNSVKFEAQFQVKLSDLSSTLTKLNIDTKLNDRILNDFAKKYCPDTHEWNNYPFYTDYKIPNQFGSFPLIYDDVRVDRKFMENVEKYFDTSVSL